MVDFVVIMRSDPGLLRCVRGLVRQFVLGGGFSEEKADEVVLAVDEACANSIRHAYNGDAQLPVIMSFNRDAAWTSIEVRDHGRPAPRERVQKCLDDVDHEHQLTPGGLGVPLMKKVFDIVTIEPGAEGGNVVALRLKNPE